MIKNYLKIAWRNLLRNKIFSVIKILGLSIGLNWLQDYQYRVDLSWWIFAAAGIGALVITVSTVSFQAIRAAITNPIKSLRTE